MMGPLYFAAPSRKSTGRGLNQARQYIQIDKTRKAKSAFSRFFTSLRQESDMFVRNYWRNRSSRSGATPKLFIAAE